jgi:aminoglycoside/choline kinase family phosphotransferase
MKYFLPLAAHRLMQALGAYAKLGGRLGKKTFLAFIPPGLILLEEVLEECGRERFPFLHAAVEAAAVRFGERF